MATVTTAEPAPRASSAARRPSRRWMVGAVAALVVCAGASLIAVAPSHRAISPAAGGGLLATTAHWTISGTLHGPAGGPIELGSISCSPSDAGTCVAVGGPFVASRPAAGDWSVSPAPVGAGFLTSVSCGGGGHCVAVAQPSGGVVGNLALSTADGGLTWATRRLPASVTGLSAVSCSTALRCVAVGEGRKGAVVAVTADGGAVWSAAPAPATLGGLDAIGCSSGQGDPCIAVGWFRDRSAAAIGLVPSGTGSATGAGWSVLPAPAGVAALDAVACPSGSTCYVGGFLTAAAGRRFPGAVARTDDGGHHWLLLALPASAGPVNALSCPDQVSCVAAGVSAAPGVRSAGAATGPPGMGMSTMDAGATWQADALPQSASGLAGVACGPAGAVAPTCVATAAGPASASLTLAGTA